MRAPNDRSWRRRAAWRATLAAALTTVVIGGLGVMSQTGGAAAPSGWSIATVPGTGADDILLGSTCVNAVQCWAVGISIQNINGPATYAPIVETWNGASWTLAPQPPLPPGQGGGFFDLSCLNGSDCWAVGAALNQPNGNGNPAATLIEHWNGSAWSIVPSPTPTANGAAGAILHHVTCTSTSNCVAVGDSNDGTGMSLNALIEQWNGATWTIVPGAATGQPFDQLTNVTCLAANDCWAVGSAGPAQQNPNFLPIFPNAIGDQGLIEHWNGLSWSVVPSATEPSPSGGYLNGLACVTAANCWASGSTTDSSGMASGILLQRWNGSSWTNVSSSAPAPNPAAGAILSSISCLSATQCWGVGSSGSFGGGGGGNFQPQSFIENWNGSGWSIDPSPNVTALSFLNTISCVQAVACLAAGGSLTQLQNDPGLRPLVEQMAFPPASSQGIVLGARDGGVFNYGTTQFAGSMGGRHLNAPVVGIAETPDGGGYWLVGSDGGVFNYGDAHFFGSMGGQRLNQPVVGIAAAADGQGYWLVASDGGVFNFGSARFHGSMGGHHLNAPVVGLTASSDGGGYWLVGSDGGVFNYGDAAFFKSAGGQHLNAPMTGIAAAADDGGYWLVGSDGGVFTYGDATYVGSVPGQGIVGQPPVVGISRTPSGRGYWLVGANGAVYTYGDAAFLGAPNASKLVAPVSGIASS